MSNNEQRNELAEIVSNPEHHYDTGSHYELSATDAADAILAAGYSKPRTIRTVEELDALPEGSVIHSGEGAVFEKCHSGWIETGRGGVMDPEDIALPATVIHDPTTEATP